MDRDFVLKTLKANEDLLRGHGITHAALFGSRARDDARAESDIDIMVEFDPAMAMTVYDYVGVKEFVAGLFDGRVDVVNKAGLKPSLASSALAAALYAF